ncbi:FAD-dependent oxidoreductase [Glutamicibacter halophytocola]|uniref:FAD-dependent oxidoreductase n=1 Tax=Glutamicibacter halophytocola TaxID=1933880 RepID=UPI00321B41B0
MVDSDGGALLTRRLLQAGVEVISEVKATGVVKDEHGFTALATSTHGEIPGGALLISTGVRARTELAEGRGLAVGRGIQTNSYLCADTEQRIYALGDCAEVDGAPPVGLLAPGWAQASWLAQHLTSEAEIPAPDFSASDVLMLKGQGIEVAAAGDISAGFWDNPELQATVFADPSAGRYLKVVTLDGAVTGFLSIGLPQTSAELVLAYERGSALPQDRSTLLRLDDPAVDPSSAIPSDDDQLCRPLRCHLWPGRACGGRRPHHRGAGRRILPRRHRPRWPQVQDRGTAEQGSRTGLGTKQRRDEISRPCVVSCDSVAGDAVAWCWSQAASIPP